MWLIVVALVCMLAYLFYGRDKSEVQDGYKYLIGISVAESSTPWVKVFVNDMLGELAQYKDSNILVKEAFGSTELQEENIEELLSRNLDLLIIVAQDTAKVDAYMQALEEEDRNKSGVKQPYIAVGAELETASNKIGINYDSEAMAEAMVKGLEDKGETATKNIAFLYDPRSELDVNLAAALEESVAEGWTVEKIPCRGQRREAKNRMIDHIVMKREARIVMAASAEQAKGAYLGMEELRAEGFSFYAFDNYLKNSDQGGEFTFLSCYLKTENIASKTMSIATAILAQEEYDEYNELSFELVEN